MHLASYALEREILAVVSAKEVVRTFSQEVLIYLSSMFIGARCIQSDPMKTPSVINDKPHFVITPRYYADETSALRVEFPTAQME